jgi:ABC-type oligopeptide transport system substrate-binding subunit
MSEDELESAVKSGNYDIAFYPFKASTQSAVSFLNDIIDDNPTEFSTQNALSAIKSAQQASDLKSTAKELRSAERAILLTYSICPMLYETSYYACAKGITGIQFHAGTGRVNFVNATKE